VPPPCIRFKFPNRQSRLSAWPHTGERSEAQLIPGFAEKIGQLRPQLITFNGHSFDLPVLRAMVNRIPAARLQVRQYFHCYTEDALDFCDVLGSYVRGAKVKLAGLVTVKYAPGIIAWRCKMQLRARP
jgi:hypothetical protein